VRASAEIATQPLVGRRAARLTNGGQRLAAQVRRTAVREAQVRNPQLRRAQLQAPQILAPVQIRVDQHRVPGAAPLR